MPAHAPTQDAEIGRTVKLLGGQKKLGRPIHNRLEAHDLIEKGMRTGVLIHLVNGVTFLKETPHHGLERAIGISLRTYQRHQDKPNALLSPEQSGRTWKFAEILGRAIELFGSTDEAESWLQQPAMALDRRKPIDLLSTPPGVESVENHLTRLEYGVYT